MDGDKYRQFLSLVDGVIHRVGIGEVRGVGFVCDTGSLRVTPTAFESISGQRQIEQQFRGGSNHRSFYVGGHEVTAVYSIPQPRTVRQHHGEYIDLCGEPGCDDPTDIISDREACEVLSEQSVIAAEAVSDG